MIISEHAQNTPEWMAERAGIPTASNFDKIVTTKGEPSKQVEKYIFELAGERLLGYKPESYTNSAMQRGIELEPEAKALYSFLRGVNLEDVGLCWKDEKKLAGASPDGLLGNGKGIIEVKCPILTTFVEYMLKDKIITDYFQQVQGQLWVTDREYCDLMAYYPGLEPIIKRVERDEVFICKLESEIDKFNKKLNEITEKLRG